VVQAVFPDIAVQVCGRDVVSNIIHVHSGTAPTVETIQPPVQQADQRLQTDGPDEFRLRKELGEKHQRNLDRKP